MSESEFTWDPDEYWEYRCERCDGRVEGEELKDAWRAKIRMHLVCDAAVDIERLTRENRAASKRIANLERGLAVYRKDGHWHVEDAHGADADLSGYGPCGVCAWEREQREEESKS